MYSLKPELMTFASTKRVKSPEDNPYNDHFFFKLLKSKNILQFDLNCKSRYIHCRVQTRILSRFTV